MTEIGTEVPKKPTFFARMKERYVQENLGAAMAKDVEARTPLADKLKQRIDRIVATETHTSLDAQVEAEYLKAYRRIYTALGENKAKQAMEKLAPVFVFNVKAIRAVSHGVDQGLRVFSIFSVAKGLFVSGAEVFIKKGDPIKTNLNVKAGENFSRAYWTGMMGFGNIAEHLVLQSAKTSGFVGEKMAGIVNTILYGR